MGEKKKISLGTLLESHIELSQEEKGIIRYLGGRKSKVNVADIVEYLKDHGYDKLDKKEAIEKLDYLMKVGYVRSKTIGKGDNREEKFYLSKWTGGGGRRRRSEQGRGFVRDVQKGIERFVSSIFILVGLGFLVYQTISITGAFISSTQEIVPGFIFAFILLCIGVFLLVGSFKKKK